MDRGEVGRWIQGVGAQGFVLFSGCFFEMGDIETGEIASKTPNTHVEIRCNYRHHEPLHW